MMADLIRVIEDEREVISVPQEVRAFFCGKFPGVEVVKWMLKESRPVLKWGDDLVDGLVWMLESETGLQIKTLSDLFGVEDSQWEDWFAEGFSPSVAKNLVDFLVMKMILVNRTYDVPEAGDQR